MNTSLWEYLLPDEHQQWWRDRARGVSDNRYSFNIIQLAMFVS